MSTFQANKFTHLSTYLFWKKQLLLIYDLISGASSRSMAFCPNRLGLNLGGAPGSNRGFFVSNAVNLFSLGIFLIIKVRWIKDFPVLSSFLSSTLSNVKNKSQNTHILIWSHCQECRPNNFKSFKWVRKTSTVTVFRLNNRFPQCLKYF